ncbi:hypothetical protein ONZ43_g7251 [Nemania bipapillata]|uniref:Uncharacterized protein n=1 Tax=Nemania bipapillata TaxID=110536 RepID=A0ACC2HT34_9PEZI|nr:hypothetical protein ONZ43_g7251 [Nemania bipapillata]
MTETKDREVVREYFLSMLGHDIEIEKHFAQINAWKKANFPVYIVEQKVGDFILVPPLAPHQTLDLALHEALPKARLVCRDEQYKNKAIIYYTLEKYYKELQSFEESAEVSWLGLGQELMQNSARTKQMVRDFKKLFTLFTELLVDEMFGDKQMNVEYIPFDSNITCSYCRSNIFNRFLTCLQWCEQWQWSELVEKHETWRAMIIEQDGFVDINLSPQPLELARKISGKKSVAQICQEQLRRRPWNDITKPPEREPEESDDAEVDDDGNRIKKKPKKRKKKQGETYRCHVCSHKDFIYKLHFCSTCTSAYCYGVMWRAFDMMPQAVMEQEHWQCPKCLKICNCGACRQSGNTEPYIPKNTLLGHDTRPIADDRSVESIVDFRVHNLSWLKAAGEENRSKDSRRMNRLRQQADAEKAKDPLASLEADNAPHELDQALQESIANGYGDQSHIISHEPRGEGEPHDLAPVAHGEPGSQVEVADMSGLQDAEGESIYPDLSDYPDPTMLDRGRMMGMGFYEQDESTDRILFDAFQMPTADALNNEPQISDFVKKTLRLAKRKARLEQDDDPDFQGPKSHRKKPKTGNIEQLVNLDPALLGALGDNTPTPTREVGPNLAAFQGPPEAAEGQNGGQTGDSSVPVVPAKPVRVPLPIDPLRPTLRHAKPMTSYVEAEEPLDEPEDTVPIGIFETEETQPSVEPRRSAVDLAADAVRAITGMAPPEEPREVQATPQHIGKRRGRPPRNSLSTDSSPATEQKRRGRPPGRGRARRSTLTRVENAEDSDMADVDDDADVSNTGQENVTVAELEAQLAEELKSREDNDETQAEDTPAPRRRGRPPGPRRSQPSQPRAVSSTEPEEAPEPTKDFRSMSLRERMALKGKKIRIGQRDRPGDTNVSKTATPTPTSARRPTPTPPTPDMQAEEPNATPKHGRAELIDSDFEPPARVEDSPSVASESEPDHDELPQPQRPKQPTVVRLALSDDESSGNSVFDSSDDEIPARRPPPTRVGYSSVY